MSTIYEWADAVQVASKRGVSVNAMVTASVVGKELDRVRKSCNGLDFPEAFVEHSRSTRAKTHKLFEWNDKAASKKYRLDQASYVIRCVKVKHELPDGEEISVRAFSSIRNVDNPRGPRVYVKTIEAIKEDAQMESEILMEALAGLVSWRRKWHDLNLLAQSVGYVDRAIKQLETSLS